MSMSRRVFLAATGLLTWSRSAAQGPPAPAVSTPDAFPAQDPAIVREMVGVSHGNVARVRELLAARPALANAAWDWGYGDWESALGAASHVGNREIATMLIGAGARPSIFSAAMLGQLDVVRGFVAASPGIQKTRGPHGLTLMSHAKAGQAAEVVEYLESIGDADIRYTNEALEAEDRAALVGTYAFGPAANDRLIVSVNERTGLVIKREGGVERNLFHRGARAFHPTGAEAVRIRFEPGNPSRSVAIEDGGLILTARRVSD